MIALELLAEFIDEPQKAARLASERRPWPVGLAALMVSGGSLFLAQAVSRHFLPVASGPASLVAVCLWSVLTGFLLAAALHLLADAYGHAGSGAGLFVLIGLSELVWALVLPCALVLKAGRLDSIPALMALLSLAGLLNMRLKARSIRHIYGISATRAWGLLMLPYIGGFLFVAAVAAAAILSATVSLFQAFR